MGVGTAITKFFGKVSGKIGTKVGSTVAGKTMEELAEESLEATAKKAIKKEIGKDVGKKITEEMSDEARDKVGSELLNKFSDESRERVMGAVAKKSGKFVTDSMSKESMDELVDNMVIESIDEMTGKTASKGTTAFAKETFDQLRNREFKAAAGGVLDEARNGVGKIALHKNGAIALGAGATALGVREIASIHQRLRNGENPALAVAGGTVDNVGGIGSDISQAVGVVGNTATGLANGAETVTKTGNDISNFFSNITGFVKDNPWVLAAGAAAVFGLGTGGGIGRLVGIAGMAAAAAICFSGKGGDILNGIKSALGMETDGASKDASASVANGAEQSAENKALLSPPSGNPANPLPQATGGYDLAMA
jgi:hypothetical protein